MSQFSRILQKILKEEGSDIFKYPTRFWAIAEDYAGGETESSLERDILRYLVQANVLIRLGDAYTAGNDQKEAIVREVEDQLIHNTNYSESEVESFLQQWCQAFGWNVTMASTLRNQLVAAQAAQAKKDEEDRIRREKEEREQRVRQLRAQETRKNLLTGGVILLLIVVIAFLLKSIIFSAGSGGNDNAGGGDTYVSGTPSSDSEQLLQNVKDSVGSDAEFEPVIIGDHVYAIFNYKDLGLDSWEGCKSYCESKGGYMAVINDADENSELYSYVCDCGFTMAMFGYKNYYQDSNNDWRWVHGDSDYTNWASGQPNNGSTTKTGEREPYAEFFGDTGNGQWNDARFGVNTWRFICEWE